MRTQVEPTPRQRVPTRAIAVAIGMVLATAAILLLGWEVRRVLTWIVVAALLSVVLGPVVDLAEHRLHLRRALATLLVFLVFLVALAGIVTVFVRPLATEGPEFVDRLPGYVEDARAGRGPVGGLVQRYNLDQYLERNQGRLRESANRFTQPALGVLRSIFSTVVALVTIFVVTFLMVLQGPKLLQSWMAALPEDRQERVRRVAADCSKAVTGYMTGNLVISAIAGTLTYVVLWVMGVPYKGVVALFVGFADLIPLVGATLGAVARRPGGAGVLRRLPAGREPPAPAGHHVAHRAAVGAHGHHCHLARRGAAGVSRRAVRHPGGRHPARHRPRPLRRLPGPAQDRAHHRAATGADVVPRRPRPPRRGAATHAGYSGTDLTP
jgi:predicted PurR-regulated permease PerM